jgi:hypothetical protein
MKLILLIIFFFTTLVRADCTFNITNYSDTIIAVKAGFYKQESSVVTIDIASSKIFKVKSVFKCNTISPLGFGMTYIDLITQKSQGGWRYDPVANMIRGVGYSNGSQDMVFATAPNGENLVLFNNNSPNADSFDVRIEKAQRNISRQIGSIN